MVKECGFNQKYSSKNDAVSDLVSNMTITTFRFVFH